MKQRWRAVAVLAVGLFAVNVVTRLIVRLAFEGNATAESRASIAMFAVIGAVLAVVAFRRAQWAPPSTWVPELVVAALGGLLLTMLVGPFVSGDSPFAGGAGAFFVQVLLYSGFATAGVLLGYWVATAMGLDHRSKTLTAFAKAKLARPRRVVRR